MLKQVLRMREVDAMTPDAQRSSMVLGELQAEFGKSVEFMMVILCSRSPHWMDLPFPRNLQVFLSRCSFVISLSILAQVLESIVQMFVSEHMDLCAIKFPTYILNLNQRADGHSRGFVDRAE